MYLKCLKLKNFRRIKDAEIRFNKCLAVIVGENNIGKTTIVDAIRTVLDSANNPDALFVTVDDFTRQVEGIETNPIEISLVFDNLSHEEEAAFLEALVYFPAEDRYEAQLHVKYELNDKKTRALKKSWCGAFEGKRIPQELLEKCSLTYLKPLRDPDQGLKPGRYSQIARLLQNLSSSDSQKQLESLVKESHEKVEKEVLVKTATKVINDNLLSISGDELAQKTKLGFSSPEFNRIVANLRATVSDFELWQNGLGYNNLLYIAAVIGNLKEEDYDPTNEAGSSIIR